MVIKIPKNSPSLLDLRGSGENIERYIWPKRKYVIAYEDIAAFKRRKKSDYEAFVNKITSLTLTHFVDYLKKEKCIKKISMNKDEFCREDISQISLVSPAPSITVLDDKISFNTSSLSSEDDKDFKGIECRTQSISEIGKKNQNQMEFKHKEKQNSIKLSEESIEDGSAVQYSKIDVHEGKLEKQSMKDRIKLNKMKPGTSKKHKLTSKTDSRDLNVNVLFKNGNRYQGRISCYMMEGKGTYKWKDGTTLKGTFTDGIAEGLGLIKWPDGSWYDGEIKSNRRHGRGISVLKEKGNPKMCYFGNWKNSRTNGKGMIIYGENNWYDGYWKKGRPDGFGLRQYPSGSRYLGEWKDGRENGWGTMIWSNQDIYTGNWTNGTMEGRGTYAWRCVKSNSFVHPMQNTYIGQWKNGKKHGHGSILLANGVVIHAFWVNGIKDGPGQIICRNGLVIESSHLFKEDKVYRLDSPIMIPFWNTWYCEFLSSYRSGLFFVQSLEKNASQTGEEKKDGEEVPNSANECSNNIPIFAPIESLPLWNFVLRAVCQPIPDLTGEISYIIRTEDIELLSSEEMWLRKVITNRMPDITCLYQHYASIACDKKPPFKAGMFRIMLWQMCMDCGLEKTRFNLCQLDSEAGCDSYPFAIILIFQMIHYLLLLAHELCVRNREANPNIPGKWGGAFDYFLTNYALPGMQKTSQIPELCNTIPLRNVFCLYEHIGVPVTVGKIFGYFLSNDESDSDTEEKPQIKISNKIYGQNKIYPDGRIVFEEVGGTLLGTIFDFQESKSTYYDINEVKFLGKEELARILFHVCPKVKKNDIPDCNYEVSYLEFCEFIKNSLKKYNSIIDPDSEVTLITMSAKCDLCNRYVELERHYEVEHQTKAKNELEEENLMNTKESSDTTVESLTFSGDSQEFASIHDKYHGKSYIICADDASNSVIVSTQQNAAVGNNEICPCENNELISTNEEISCTKICKCTGSCECLSNKLKSPENSENLNIVKKENMMKESSFTTTDLSFKHAKTITLTACDSDCQCFCHENSVSEYNNEKSDDEEEDISEDIIDLENTDLDLERESLEGESEDTSSSIKISDAINYLCDKRIEEEELKSEIETFNEGENVSEYIKCLDFLDSVLEQEMENELYEGESFGDKDSLLTGEDFTVIAKKILSDLDQIEVSNDNKGVQKISEKLLDLSFPKFKIKYGKIFGNVSTKGMTPRELKKRLRLEGSQKDLFENQDIEDIEKELINESLSVVKIVAKQRLYEKLLMEQFKKTVSQLDSGEYWENFLENVDCTCTCKNCLSGLCDKVKEKIKFVVGDEEFEFSSDSSVTIN